MMKKNSSTRRWFLILVLSLPLFVSACLEVDAGGDRGHTSTIKGCESFGFVRPPTWKDGPRYLEFAVTITKQPAGAKILADGELSLEHDTSQSDKSSGKVTSNNIFRFDPKTGAAAGRYSFAYKILGYGKNSHTNYFEEAQKTNSDAYRDVILTEGCKPSQAVISEYDSRITAAEVQSDGGIKVTWSTSQDSLLADDYRLKVVGSGTKTLAIKTGLPQTGEATFSRDELLNAKVVDVVLELHNNQGIAPFFSDTWPEHLLGPGALKPGDPIVRDDEITVNVGEDLIHDITVNDNFSGNTGVVKLSELSTVYYDENGTLGIAKYSMYRSGPMYYKDTYGYTLVRAVYERPGKYITEFETEIASSNKVSTQRLIATVSGKSSSDVNPATNDSFTGLAAFKEQILDVLKNDGLQSPVTITAADYVAGQCDGGCYDVSYPEENMRIDGSVLKFTGPPGNYIYKYTAKDAQGKTGTANVAVELVNFAPVAKDDTAEGKANQDIRIDVLRHDTDENINKALSESDMLRIDSFTQPDQQGGSVWENGNNLMFRTSAAGTYTFKYKAKDSFGGVSDWAKVTVTVTSPNVAPVITSFTKNKSTVIHDPLAGPYDETFTATCAATDINGDTLTYGLTGNGAITNTGTGTWTVNPAPAASGNQTYTCAVSDGQGGSVSATTIVYVTTDLYGHSIPNTGAFVFENVAVGNIAEFTFTAPATASDLIIGCSAFSNPPAAGPPPTVISVDVVPLAAGSWSGTGCAAASSLQMMLVDGVPNVNAFSYTPGQRYVVYLSNPAGPDPMDIHCDVSAWYEFTSPAGLAPQALMNVVRGVANPGAPCP